MKRGFWVCLWLVVFMWYPVATLAGSLADRLDLYPQWYSKPSVAVATGDLAYPEPMEGVWTVTSTLVEQIAPLAPEMVTPGFEDNRSYLKKPITFKVKFSRRFVSTFPAITGQFLIVADRAFNGLNISQAYLAPDVVLAVKVDPQNPNHQITFFKGDYQLTSQVVGRASEMPNPRHFIASEVTQQIFRSPTGLYLNEVETTTSYQLLSPQKILANQVTAIYLSPQDPDYFKASGHPVALYKYLLKMKKT